MARRIPPRRDKISLQPTIKEHVMRKLYAGIVVVALVAVAISAKWSRALQDAPKGDGYRLAGRCHSGPLAGRGQRDAVGQRGGSEQQSGAELAAGTGARSEEREVRISILASRSSLLKRAPPAPAVRRRRRRRTGLAC